MRLHGLTVIVKYTGINQRKLSFNNKECTILSYKFIEDKVVLLVRHEDLMETFYNDEVIIHPDELQRWNKEQERMKEWEETHG